MTQRRAVQKQPTGFTAGNLTNLIAIPLISGLFAIGGFYYLTNSTLARHTVDIDQIKVEVKKGNDEDGAARAKIRDEFLAAQMKTTEGIGKLDTRLAVAETQQKQENDTLNKIADTLQKLTSFPDPKR